MCRNGRKKVRHCLSSNSFVTRLIHVAIPNIQVMYQTVLAPSLTILHILQYPVDFQCAQAYRKMAGAGLVLPSLPAKYRNGRPFPAGIPDDGEYLLLLLLGRRVVLISWKNGTCSILRSYVCLHILRSKHPSMTYIPSR